MAWGLLFPSDFGRFFPDGDFEFDPIAKESLWRDRLRRHYLAQAEDEQIRLYDYRKFDTEGIGSAFGAGEYPTYVTGKFTYGIGIKGKPDSDAFVAAEENEAPQTFYTLKFHASLGSMVKLSDRIIAVNEQLKDIIENLEPGVHQFFRIDLHMPQAGGESSQYYTLVIGQYLESFSPPQSKPSSYVSYPKYPGFYNLEKTKKGLNGLALDHKKIGNSHLWRERAFRETLTCLSDNLKTEIENAGLDIPTCHEIRVY